MSKSTPKSSGIRAYTPNELAELYEVSTKTLNRWLKPHRLKIGKREGWYYTVKQVRIIIELIGPPDSLDAAMALSIAA